jgi:hypothetical protein
MAVLLFVFDYDVGYDAAVKSGFTSLPLLIEPTTMRRIDVTAVTAFLLKNTYTRPDRSRAI